MKILFAYVFEYWLAQTHRSGRLRHVFVLDEGKRVFSAYKERQEAAGLPVIDELTAQLREFGEGLIVANQEATKLTESLKANTYTKILLATGRGDKEKIVIDGDERYRLHISRSCTAFYDIYEDLDEVRVTELLPTDEAHKRYGY